MHSRSACLRPGLLVLLVVALAAAWPGAAGSQQDPELVDPEGDQEVSRGTLVLPVQEDPFQDVDILAAWFEPSDIAGSVLLSVQTAAPFDPEMQLNVTVQVRKGPLSLHTSTASGITYSFATNGTRAAGPVASWDIRPAELASVGGDEWVITEVVTSRRDAGPVPQDATDLDDQGAMDRAGPAARSFMVPRGPVVPAVSIDVLSITGELAEDGGYDAATGAQAALRVRNDGTDTDTFRFEPGAGTVAPTADGAVAPGGHVDVVWRVDGGVAPGTYALTVTTQRGAEAQISLAFAAPPAPVPAERQPTPAGLAFLTTPALALGLDRLFGDGAELALMAALLLLAILVLYLLTHVMPNVWEPAPAAGPATKSEVRLLAPDADPLPPGIHPGRRPAAAPVSAGQGSAAPPSSPRPRPMRASTQDIAAIRAHVDRLDATPGGRVRSLAVRLEAIRHEPQEPAAGQSVTTTATAHNEGADTARFTVELVVDGQAAASQEVRVPAGASRDVRLDWTAGPGPNQPRLSVRPGR